MDREMITVAGTIPKAINRRPMKTRPGIVWKTDRTGINVPAVFRGRRERRMPSRSPRRNPAAVEIRT